MTDQKKTPGGGNRVGARNTVHPKLTKPTRFPQAPILWQAHKECFQRIQDDPTPVNRVIAQIIATHWRNAHGDEVLK
jgi:hypothetical protein